jgi:hypothetical protein
MKTIEEINKTVNRTLNEEIERRLRSYLEASQGIDWTAKFESVVKENARLREALEKIKAHVAYCAFDSNGGPDKAGISHSRNEMKDIARQALSGKNET